jgi:hypothetical protein
LTAASDARKKRHLLSYHGVVAQDAVCRSAIVTESAVDPAPSRASGGCRAGLLRRVFALDGHRVCRRDLIFRVPLPRFACGGTRGHLVRPEQAPGAGPDRAGARI